MRRILRIVLSIVFVVFAVAVHAQKSAKRSHTATFGGRISAPVRQALSNKTDEISFDIDLGMPLAKPLTPITGLPRFSSINWTGLSNATLPAGASIVSVAPEGMPEIPYLVLTIAIPPGADNFVPFISGEQSATLNSILLPPAPYQHGDSTIELRYDADRYRREQPHSMNLSAPVRFRSLRMIGLRIPLLDFDPRHQVVSAKTKFRCGIRFTASPESELPALQETADPLFSALYQKAVVNSADIKRYSAPMRPHRPVQRPQGFDGERTFDTTVTGWIDRDAPYIKLTVTHTGLYRVAANELAASGIDAASWRASDVRLFNKGNEVPVWVDTAANGDLTAIEFYGERLPGFTNEYYNWSTDSNAYWLTNSSAYQGTPKRFLPRVIDQEPPVTIAEGKLSLHHERDCFYYGGDKGSDDSRTLHRTDWIPGERFIWYTLRAPYTDNGNLIVSSIADTFAIAKLPADIVGDSVHVKIFVRGISATRPSGTHRSIVRLNGTQIADTAFFDYDSILISIAVPLTLILEGNNTIGIEAANGGANIDQWYLDYYAVDLPVALAASSDTAIAKGQWDFRINTNDDLAKLSLISTAEPDVFDLTDGVRLLSRTASGSIYNYRDILGSSEKHYVAATASSFLRPARISAWNVPGSIMWRDILDTAQGADYILLTHPDFMEASKKLAERRKAAGLRTKIVTTDEVYNAFNFGSDEPWAIRRFLHYAFDFYSGAPPSFVTLMGDATWDPKFTLNNPLESPENRTIHRNFVHSYGIPSSDAIYTTVEGDSLPDSLSHEMVIARIPVESPEEAEHFLSKLEEYEKRPPEEWNRNMLFTIGGSNAVENGRFWFYLHKYFDDLDNNGGTGIRNPPMGINTTVISRTDFSEGIDKTHVAELQSEFRKGKSLVYFFGHGATFITDVFYSDPGLYRNEGLYPVFITLSCRTGAYAEPNQITLNEAFLRQPAGGVIMAFGTTGFGEVQYDDHLSSHIFGMLGEDTSVVRQPPTGPHRTNMASVFTLAKFISSVIDPHDPQTLSDSWYNSLHQYTVLGDAAMGFALRPQPEFNVSASEVALTDTHGEARTVYSVSDSFVTVTAKLHNVGRVAEDEVHVAITNVQPKREIVIIDTLARLDSSETITVSIPLDTFAIGINQLRVKIDNDERFAETEERDNEAILTFQVSGFTATPFFPPEGAKNFCDASGDSLRFILLLPNPSAISGIPVVEIEVDTTNAFTSPKSLGSFTASGAFFERSVPRSILPASGSGVIWWRSRLLVGNEPSPWSLASVNIASSGSPMFSYTTGDQLERTIVSGLHRDGDGALIIPQNDTIQWEVIAHGLYDTTVTLNPIAQILADGRSLATFTKNGFLVAPLTADSANLADTLYEFLNFTTNIDSVDSRLGAQLARSFDSVVALIPDGRMVIVLANFQPNIPYFAHTSLVTDALKSLGSRNGLDSLNYFWSYAMIGKKGSSPGSAKERFGQVSSTGVDLFDTVVTTGSSGIARTPFVFVANKYGKLFWQAAELAKDSSLLLRVLGQPRLGGLPVTLKNIVALGSSSADLSDIDAIQFPRLAIEMRLARPKDVALSPRLYAIEYEYDPAPEFVIEENSLAVDPGEVEEGLETESRYTVKNLLCIDAKDVPLALIRSYLGASDTLVADMITQFNGRSSEVFVDSIPTLGYEGRVTLSAVVNPGGKLNEQLLFNNRSSRTFDVRRDSSKPDLEVLFDNVRINNGDFVSSRVEIAMRLLDESPVRIKDSSSVIGILRPLDTPGGTVTLDAKNPSADYSIQFVIPPAGSLQAALIVSPKIPFPAGRYGLTAFGFDGSGNPSDTLEFEFVVSDKQGIEHVMNYPNPFTDNTAFTFVLRSANTANIHVYVYTTAGRRIRTLTLPAANQKPGINSIEWDGRDEDGNDVANGTYLYKVVAAAKNDDGSEMTDAVFEKAVRSR